MAKRKKSPYPDELLADVAWSFTEPGGDTPAAFAAAVGAYQVEIFEAEGDAWRPDEVVLRAPCVRVTCEYWDEPGELAADLAADGGEGFTAGELLFKIHQAFAAQLRTGDHHFFEGLARVGPTNANAPPVYEVMTGS